MSVEPLKAEPQEMIKAKGFKTPIYTPGIWMFSRDFVI